MDTVYILFEAGEPLSVYADPDIAEIALSQFEQLDSGLSYYVESFGVIS